MAILYFQEPAAKLILDSSGAKINTFLTFSATLSLRFCVEFVRSFSSVFKFIYLKIFISK